MGLNKLQPCPCGSGKDSNWQLDGYGIPLCRTCDDCHAGKMAGYRRDIHEHYETDEPIEPDEDRFLQEAWEPDDDWPI